MKSLPCHANPASWAQGKPLIAAARILGGRAAYTVYVNTSLIISTTGKNVRGNGAIREIMMLYVLYYTLINLLIFDFD